jgi:hypothetical protein
VTAELGDGAAELSWPGRDGTTQRGHLALPGALEWSAHRGETDPPLGWFSPRFGAKVACTTLVGEGTWTGTLDLRTTLEVRSSDSGSATPRREARSARTEALADRPEAVSARPEALTAAEGAPA